MRPALFLDRDGVINIEKNYLYKREEFQFIEGVFESCRYFKKLGYLIIIITNQAGIARKIYKEGDYQNLTTWMLNEFLKQGVEIDKVYHCPHHPDFSGECSCRKPKPGMVLAAKSDFDIDLNRSILVGDKRSDLLAALSAGVENRVLVESGHEISEKDKEYATLVIPSVKSLQNFLG